MMLVVVVCAVFAVLYFVLRRMHQFDSKPVHMKFTSPPSLAAMMFRAFTSSFFKPEGQLPSGVKDIPQSSCEISGAQA